MNFQFDPEKKTSNVFHDDQTWERFEYNEYGHVKKITKSDGTEYEYNPEYDEKQQIKIQRKTK